MRNPNQFDSTLAELLSSTAECKMCRILADRLKDSESKSVDLSRQLSLKKKQENQYNAELIKLGRLRHEQFEAMAVKQSELSRTLSASEASQEEIVQLKKAICGFQDQLRHCLVARDETEAFSRLRALHETYKASNRFSHLVSSEDVMESEIGNRIEALQMELKSLRRLRDKEKELFESKLHKRCVENGMLIEELNKLRQANGSLAAELKSRKLVT